jgi:MFS family permease
MSSPLKYEQTIYQPTREEGDIRDVLDESYISSKSVYEVRGESAPLAAALALDRPHFFSKQMRRLYLVCLVAYLSTSSLKVKADVDSCINGFDASVMTGINSIEAYLSYFHIESLGSGTGIVFAMFSIAQLIGAFVAGMFRFPSSSRNCDRLMAVGPASDKWGRRVGMAIGSAIIIGGTAIQATAQQIGQFMGGRFCVGFGVSIISTAAPAYVVEMAHPAWRGAFTGGYNICTAHLE